MTQAKWELLIGEKVAQDRDGWRTATGQNGAKEQ